MGEPPTVILDACVLYPAAQRDLLMRLAVHDLIQARWTDRIHVEWMTAVLRERPDLKHAQLQRTRELMDRHAEGCLVTGYERNIPGLQLPDMNDCHVLAAAIKCGADAVVTWNIGDFPLETLKGHGMQVWTPDQLMTELLRTEEEAIIRIMREHRASLKNPPRTVEEYLTTFRDQRLIRMVQAVLHRRMEI